MKQAPNIKLIQKWLIDKNPLEYFSKDNFTIEDIDPKEWSGHFNFLVTAGEKKFVLRFKGPEWGDPISGIKNEYDILKEVESFKVGPQVYFYTENFFGESMIFEEYIEGNALSGFSTEREPEIFIEAVKFIARINKIKIQEKLIEKQEKLVSYQQHKKSWQRRLKEVLHNKDTKEWGEKVKKILPQAEHMLDMFEKNLRQVLIVTGNVFVFKSAHAGHCIKTNDGFRFFNWEKNGYGDPSFSLAVFLSSISYSEKLKDRMIQEYLKELHIANFQTLVNQRLKEREVSNLLWVLWVHAVSGSGDIKNDTGVRGRFTRVENILNSF